MALYYLLSDPESHGIALSLYQDYQPSVSFEAIYVDNCSSDGSVEFLRENYPQVKIIKNMKNIVFNTGRSIC